MRIDALGQGKLQRHEHRGPDHRVEPQDLLAHHVVVRRPEGGPFLASYLIEAYSLPAVGGGPPELDGGRDSPEGFGKVDWSFEEFRDHFGNSPSIRDLLALSRARVVTGPPALAEAVLGEIREILTRPKDPDMLPSSLDECRQRPNPNNRTEDVWTAASLGRELAGLDLAARYLQLRHAEDRPEILQPDTHRALVGLRDAGLVAADVANDLIAALDLWQAILGMSRIAVTDDTSSETMDRIPDALKPRLAQMADVADFTSGTELLRETSVRVDAHIRDVMG